MKIYNIQEIIDRVDLEELLNRYGWETQKRGRYVMVLCKFHNDTAFGSAMIYPDNPSSFICFTCGERYNIFDVYMYEHNCSFKEALKGLAEEYGIEGKQENRRKKFPFSVQELNEIGLGLKRGKNESIIGYVDDNIPIKEARSKGYRIYKECFCPNPYALDPMEYECSYIAKKGPSLMENFTSLYENEPSVFIAMIKAKANATKELHTKNYIFLRNLWLVLNESNITSKLTEEMMYQALSKIYISSKILEKAETIKHT